MAAFKLFSAFLWAFLFLSNILSRHLATAGLISAQETQRSDGLCELLVLPYRTYACQEFVAQTGDGFLLGVQRIWSPNFSGQKKASPVLLYHGILTGGDVWVLNPPGEGLGFILADAGYDVWILNYRGTTFSYGHVMYKRSDQGFWNWSLDELANEDLCTALELVFSKTNNKILLVSYSEGAQSTLAAFSQGLGTELVRRAVLMAPVSYLTSGPQLIDIAAKNRLERIFETLNIYEFSTRSPGGREVVDLLCAKASVKCYRDWFRLFSGYTCCINASRRAFIDKFETQATSVKNLDHYTQQVLTGTFAKYDYGAQENMMMYGQQTPPAYDVSKYPIDQIPTLFISSNKDSLANPVDVAHLFRELPAGYQAQAVSNFGHLDFVFGCSANTIVYQPAIEFLEA